MDKGLTLIGLDTCCYANNDLERKEVRVELGWFPDSEKMKKEKRKNKPAEDLKAGNL